MTTSAPTPLPLSSESEKGRSIRPVLQTRPLERGTIAHAPTADTIARSLRWTSEDWELEESFEGTIEEITDDEIRLRTISLDGEEGIAWLPFARLEESERKWVMLGAPVRVSIVVDRNSKPRRRECLTRVLRPSQWRVPVTEEGADRIAVYLMAEMRALLSGE